MCRTGQKSWVLVVTSVFSCLSFACLCVAVVADHWLYASEREKYNATFVFRNTSAGLWRKCVYRDVKKPPSTECSNIEYFKEVERDGLQPTESILLSLRRFMLFPMLSLVIVIAGECCFLAFHCKPHINTLTLASGVLFVIGGLFVLIGIVIFIGAITEEAGNTKPGALQEDQLHFNYRYGPSFILTIISFVTSELTGVLSVYLYISLFQQAYRKERDHLVSPVDINNEALQKSQVGVRGLGNDLTNLSCKSICNVGSSLHPFQPPQQSLMPSCVFEEVVSPQFGRGKNENERFKQSPEREQERDVEAQMRESESLIKGEDSEDAKGGSIIFSPPFPHIRRLPHEAYVRHNPKVKQITQQNPFLQFHQQRLQPQLLKKTQQQPSQQNTFSKQLNQQQLNQQQQQQISCQQTQLTQQKLKTQRQQQQQRIIQLQNLSQQQQLQQQQKQLKQNQQQPQLHNIPINRQFRQASTFSSSTQQDDKANSSDTPVLMQQQSIQNVPPPQHLLQKQNSIQQQHKQNSIEQETEINRYFQQQTKPLKQQQQQQPQLQQQQQENEDESKTELQRQLASYKQLFYDLQKQVQQRPYFYNHQFTQQQHRLRMYQQQQLIYRQQFDHPQQQQPHQHYPPQQATNKYTPVNKTKQRHQPQLPHQLNPPQLQKQQQPSQTATTATSPLYRDTSAQYSPLVSSDDWVPWVHGPQKKKPLKKNHSLMRSSPRARRVSKNHKRKNGAFARDLNNNNSNNNHRKGSLDESEGTGDERENEEEDDSKLQTDHEDDTLTDGSNFVIQLKNSPTLHRTFRHSDFNLPICADYLTADFSKNLSPFSPHQASFSLSPYSNTLSDKAKSMHELREGNTFTGTFFANYCTPDALQALVQPMGALDCQGTLYIEHYLGRTTPV